MTSVRLFVSKPVLQFAVLVFASLWLALAQAAEPVGKVLFAVRGVEVVRVQGAAEPAKKGTLLYQGDKVVTGEKGRAQIQFVDGARTALRPGSELVIEQYEVETASQDGELVVASGGSAVLGLLKGGMRAVSGSITKENPEGMSVKTPVATMGIRGTDFTAALVPTRRGKFVLNVAVRDGVVRIFNGLGSIDVNAGEFASADPDTAPTLRLRPPEGLLSGEENQEESSQQEEGESENQKDGPQSGQNSQQGSEGNKEGKSENDQAEGDGKKEGESEGSSQGDSGSDGEGDSGGDDTKHQSPNKQGPGGAQGTGESSQSSSGGGSTEKNSEGEEEGEGSEEESSDNGGQQSSGENDGGSQQGSGSGEQEGGDLGNEQNAPVSNNNQPPGAPPPPPPTQPPAPENPPETTGGQNLQNPDEVTTAPRIVSVVGAQNGSLDGLVIGQAPNAEAELIRAEDGSARQFLTQYSQSQLEGGGLEATLSIVGEDVDNASTFNKGADPETGFEWGRWASGSFTAEPGPSGSNETVTLAGQESVHWVYGLPLDGDPLADITGSALYSLVGNTEPTDNEGNIGVLGVADLFVNFTESMVNLNLGLTINGNNWQASGEGAFLPGGAFEGSGLNGSITSQSGPNGVINGGVFNGSFSPNIVDVGGNSLPAGAGFTYGLAGQVGGASSLVTGAAVVGNPSTGP